MNKTIWLLTGLLVATTGQAAQNESTSYSQDQVAVGLGFDQGLSAILELNQDYRLVLGNDGVAFDYFAKRGRFDNTDFPANWYIGGGIWKNWDNKHDDFGVRVPVGLDWTYHNRVKFYGQLHPELVLIDDVELDLGAAIGVTYKF
ncbi:hypothetical protein DI392_11090 [Vibrio albus]|uniref:Outer membrane protein beta-barrel domain-containing protein n=1 Tax=Vibrio albus TaxID=2200953 RepID=A0A2U3B9E5_9VIBR|nr:hypothetical protein [Vibrio albus]PWI33391.1 hypothetical protein DI392_11090 [Vibrio albus]